MLVYGDQVLYFRTKQLDKDKLELECLKYTFQRDSVSFQQQTNSSSVKCELSTSGKILAYKVIDELTTGLRQPFLLLGPNDVNSRSSWYYFVVLTGKSFRVAGKFKSAGDIPENVWLLDGPCLCYLQNSCVHFTQSDRGNGMYKMTKVLPKCVGFQQNLSILWTMVTDNGLIVMVTVSPKGVAMENKEQSKTIKMFVIDFSEDQCTDCIIDATDFIPEVYAPLTKVVHCEKCEIKRIETGEGTNRKLEFKCQNRILIYTINGQLLILENGRLLDCVSLLNREGMNIYNWETADDQKFAAVHTTDHKVYIVSLDSSQVYS